MRKSLLVPVISLALIIGCAGSKPEPVKSRDLPDWVMNPPKIENGWLYLNDDPGVGLDLSSEALLKFGSKII